MVRILCCRISQIHEKQYHTLYNSASPLRQKRADGYRSREDALRCILGEVLLRTALQQRYGRWEGFDLSYGTHGKPYLANRPDFHFSISHSGQWVVLAYGQTELGIDIQQMDSKKNHSLIAKRFFTKEEQQLLTRSGGDPEPFFRIWTGKESHLKYLGTGLSQSLTSFSVLSPEAGLHYFWDTLDGHMLCLCTRETDYRMEEIHIKNAPV